MAPYPGMPPMQQIMPGSRDGITAALMNNTTNAPPGRGGAPPSILGGLPDVPQGAGLPAQPTGAIGLTGISQQQPGMPVPGQGATQGAVNNLQTALGGIGQNPLLRPQGGGLYG